MTDLPPNDLPPNDLPSPPTSWRRQAGPRPPFRAVPLRLLIPNLVTLLALVPRLDGDPLRLRGGDRMGGQRHRRRRGARRARRPHRPRAEGHLALRRRTRFARRFRRLRRGAGRRALCRRPRRDEEPRLADGARLRHRLRAEAGAVQRDARRSVDGRRGGNTSSSACRPRRARSSACCRSICACC